MHSYSTQNSRENLRQAAVASLAAKIAGRVVAVNADEGDRVKADDVLIAIADAELRANLSAAQARLRMEEINWAHQEKLAARVRSLREQATVSAVSSIRGDRVAAVPWRLSRRPGRRASRPDQ